MKMNRLEAWIYHTATLEQLKTVENLVALAICDLEEEV